MKELPKGWKYYQLNDLIEFIRNGISTKQNSEGNGKPVTRIETISDGIINGEKIGYVIENEKKLLRNRVEKNDILFSNINSTEHIGKTAIYEGLPEELYHGVNLLLLRPKIDLVFPKYLLAYLKQPIVRAYWSTRCKKAVNQSSLTQSDIICVSIALPIKNGKPDIQKQKQIVAILDSADHMRCLPEQMDAMLDEFLRSTFVEMFGDPVRNEMGWEKMIIGKTTECLDSHRRPVTESDRNPGKVPYYGANGQQGWIDTALFNESLILVAEDGGFFDAPDRGVAYRIDGPSWINNHAHILRPKREVLNIEYLHRVLKHYNFIPYISGTTRAKLTQGQLNKAPIPVPPLPLQQRFAYIVEKTEELRTCVKASQNDADDLFNSLMQKAFTGELIE